VGYDLAKSPTNIHPGHNLLGEPKSRMMVKDSGRRTFALPLLPRLWPIRSLSANIELIYNRLYANDRSRYPIFARGNVEISTRQRLKRRAFLFCFTSLPKPGKTNSPFFLISL
jgi:hypothetical protein